MKRVVFLVSGNGGNLKFLYYYLRQHKDIGLELSYVIADRECGAIQFAKEKGVRHEILTYNENNRKDLLNRLSLLRPDLVITNIHKVLDEKIVNKFTNKLINLHYSLLPAFQGLIGVEPVDNALKQHCKFVGATVHFVEKEVDAGIIIAQSAITVTDDCERNKLIDMVFRSGCLLLLNSLLMFFQQDESAVVTSKYSDNSLDCYFSPGLLVDPEQTNDFWDKLK